MFGLTKREQRWKAEQKAAETIAGVLVAAINAKAHKVVEMNKSEQLIACLEGEIAKRDARIVELEADLRGYRDGAKAEADAGDEARAECRQLRAKLAFFTGYGHDPHPSDKLIELALINFGGKWDGDRWTIEDADLHPFVRSFAAPVSEAKAHGVVIPPSPYMPGSQPTDFTDYELGEIHGRIAMWEEVKRLNAAPAAPAADAWIPVGERLPDGDVLCSTKRGVTIAMVCDGGVWRDRQACTVEPTHWMPLPSVISAKGVV